MKPFCFCVLFFLVAACVDEYALEVLPTNRDYLVVDGFINSDGPTVFRLTRLLSIADQGNAPPEIGAHLFVESHTGDNYELRETTAGNYSLTHPVNLDKRYRLRINTKDGDEYLSDFTSVKQTPPIDSVFWELNQDEKSMEIFVATHDPLDAARYYTWDYEETFQFQSDFRTDLIFQNGKVVLKDPNLNIYDCWTTSSSTRILLNSSINLSNDVINKFPITAIKPESHKLRLGYSLLVKQHVLTSEAYQYLQTLKKNTESLGTIFDPIPSRFDGNIKSVDNPDNIAIGFVSAYNVTTQRIFISDDLLPLWFQIQHPQCPEMDEDLILLISTLRIRDPAAILTFLSSGYLAPVGYNPAMYTVAVNTCVDCRKKAGIFKGGINKKPEFWPN